MKPSKHTISINYKNDYELVCISTSTKPHRICSLINRALDIQLSRVEFLSEFMFDYPDGFPFISYRFDDSEMLAKVILVKNLNEDGYFLKECRQADYLLFFKTHEKAPVKKDILHELNKIEMIQIAYFVEMNKLKATKKIRIE
jgi:hypothetical protein